MEDLNDDEMAVFKVLETEKSGLNSNQILEKVDFESSQLTDLLNSLAGKQCIEFLQQNGQLIFQARNISEVAKLSKMNENERVVFRLVKDSSNKGTWLKHIKEKSGLHTKIVTDAIKHLEKAKFIKQVKSVKTNKKVYMLYEMEPSVELTGGSWYTDEEMDLEFIDQLSIQIKKYIISLTMPRAGIYGRGKEFPTATDLHEWITGSGITHQPLSEQDIESLADRLVYDGDVRKIEGGGYAACLNPQHINEWYESPCGQCPLFKFCAKGGPVSPETCVYFKDWLQEI